MMRRSTSPRPVKHVPQRTCLACRQIKAKQELIRLVRSSDECVEVDIDGKKRGRGTYLCPSPECWETGLKGGRLEHSLRIKLSQDNREQLIRFGKDLFKK
ncbi:MAG: YlxR family protein [Chloroflexi bacterium]|nr:YlxR family protein [Chloroflexota bacterium]